MRVFVVSYYSDGRAVVRHRVVMDIFDCSSSSSRFSPANISYEQIGTTHRSRCCR